LPQDDALVLAVTHDEFLSMPRENLLSKVIRRAA
jgi:hypothetical protein